MFPEAARRIHIRAYIEILLPIAFFTFLSAPRIGIAADSFDAKRRTMVEHEIVGAGITNDAVIAAIGKVPRHEFVSAAERDKAYLDMALPIGEGQTISPPFVVAFMTQSIEPAATDKVLEIGTGSGYQAAVLSGLVKEVYSIEIVESLGHRAAKTLKRLKYDNVHTKIGDGYQGWAEHAPFNKIIVTCSPEKAPQALVDQLDEGGLMVIPVGERYQQTLYLLRKKDGKLERESLLPTLFVPMTGEAESLREKQPDAAHPVLQNASFENVEDDGAELSNWYYQRQLEVVEDQEAPEGGRFVKFSNTEPGRGSQMLQAMAVDGKQVASFDVSLKVKLENVQAGQNDQQLPIFAMSFYDKNRKQLAYRWIGPWSGTREWTLEEGVLRVPLLTHEVVLQVGLQGAVGEMCLDDVKLTPVPR